MLLLSSLLSLSTSLSASWSVSSSHGSAFPLFSFIRIVVIIWMLSLAYSFIQSLYFSSLNLLDSFLNGKKLSRVLPEQVKPSELSLYPSLQEHEKLPTLFSQVCWHPPFARAHSSLSIEQKSVFRLNLNPNIEKLKAVKMPFSFPFALSSQIFELKNQRQW